MIFYKNTEGDFSLDDDGDYTISFSEKKLHSVFDKELNQLTTNISKLETINNKSELSINKGTNLETLIKVPEIVKGIYIAEDVRLSNGIITFFLAHFSKLEHMNFGIITLSRLGDVLIIGTEVLVLRRRNKPCMACTNIY